VHPRQRDRRDARRPALDSRPRSAPHRAPGHPHAEPRGVDLNRNFPFGWRPLGGLEYSGPHALSEPESRAARNLIRRTAPDITIWFHQPFDLVDRSGGDPAIERRYAQLVRLPLVGLRRYPGSASSWQNHTMPGSTAFVVELPATVSGALVRRAAHSVLALAAEYGGADVGGAIITGQAD
jgi:protein MpaA